MQKNPSQIRDILPTIFRFCDGANLEGACLNNAPEYLERLANNQNIRRL
jgi:hypothetical protein